MNGRSIWNARLLIFTTYGLMLLGKEGPMAQNKQTIAMLTDACLLAHKRVERDTGVKEKLAEKDRLLGGCFCIADTEGNVILVVAVGEMDPEKFPKYVAFSQEKAARLGRNPSHVSSRETRDENAVPPQYAGGLRGEEFIVAFSGGPEPVDELYSAMVLNLIDSPPVAHERAMALVANDNEWFDYDDVEMAMTS